MGRYGADLTFLRPFSTFRPSSSASGRSLVPRRSGCAGARATSRGTGERSTCARRGAGARSRPRATTVCAGCGVSARPGSAERRDHIERRTTSSARTYNDFDIIILLLFAPLLAALAYVNAIALGTQRHCVARRLVLIEIADWCDWCARGGAVSNSNLGL